MKRELTVGNMVSAIKNRPRAAHINGDNNHLLDYFFHNKTEVSHNYDTVHIKGISHAKYYNKVIQTSCLKIDEIYKHLMYSLIVKGVIGFNVTEFNYIYTFIYSNFDDILEYLDLDDRSYLTTKINFIHRCNEYNSDVYIYNKKYLNNHINEFFGELYNYSEVYYISENSIFFNESFKSRLKAMVDTKLYVPYKIQDNILLYCFRKNKYIRYSYLINGEIHNIGIISQSELDTVEDLFLVHSRTMKINHLKNKMNLHKHS